MSSKVNGIGVSEEELMARATRAYFAAAREGSALIPSRSSSGVEECGGKRYCVLRNVDGVLACYRVRNDGMLKRLRRWPKDIE
jgi:hypothetical protein